MVCQLVSEKQEVNQLDGETEKSEGLLNMESSLKIFFLNKQT